MDKRDVLDRFARTHLSTKTELGVYLALDHHRPRFLSAEEVAAIVSNSSDEIDPVLRSFAEAGILHEVWLDDSPVYRRRAEIDYLAEDPDVPPAEIDPVCGMLPPRTRGTSSVMRMASNVASVPLDAEPPSSRSQACSAQRSC